MLVQSLPVFVTTLWSIPIELLMGGIMTPLMILLVVRDPLEGTYNLWIKMNRRPDPLLVATKLLARREFKGTWKQFNMIAASWIQFMNHDWIDHLEDTQQIELTAPKEVDSKCPL